jgi:hypothetical protein
LKYNLKYFIGVFIAETIVWRLFEMKKNLCAIFIPACVFTIFAACEWRAAPAISAPDCCVLYARSETPPSSDSNS